MGGTILNMLTVAIGGTLGLLVGNRLPERVQTSVVTGLGLITFSIGIDNAGQTGNPIITLLSVAIGVLIGEWLGVDDALNRFGGWLQARVTGDDDTTADANSARERFITGFVTASLLFCVGPLTFLGSLYDGMGLAQGFQMLAVKSTLDGFAALAFAASFGVGVLFSIVTIFVIQGGLALVGFLAGQVMTEPMLNETTAVGGILLMGLALILLDVKRPRVANFLPALLVAPLMVALADALAINIYPAL
jgi:uncharacterized protein